MERSEGPEGERPRARPDAGRARQDQRPRPHVPARDGHRAAAHPRGRSGDRQAHRAAASSRSSSRSRACRRSPRRSSAWASSCAAGERTIRELVIFNDEEITDDRIEERAQQFLKQVDARAQGAPQRREARREARARAASRTSGSTAAPRWKVMRAQVETSRYIRKIEFTEPVKRRLVDEVKDIVERVLEGAARARQA